MERYRIGELARLGGVSIKTVRYYSDLGLLPPAEITETGHRLYTDQDRLRLDVIRCLREVGVGLEAIQHIMQQEDSIAAALQLQMQAIELEMAQLQRKKTVLGAALRRNNPLEHLRVARTLASLNARERQQVLDQQVERLFQDVPADPSWIQSLWQGPLMQLPEHLSDMQFEAWLELADLLLDEDFILKFQAVGQEFWSQFPDEASRMKFVKAKQHHDHLIQQAVQRGVLPDSPEGQQVMLEAMQTLSPETTDVAALAAHQLEVFQRHTDPRAERFWRLLECIQNLPSRSTEIMQVHHWQVQALQTLVQKMPAPDLHPVQR
ncbi:MerR family transcriptional regulator [Deinococcus misasensis]|uniref:MerR family transcriptional regulator n=1 Tax=Deinococcus misasensis TaxID=392413 RepID=UPI0005526090|nr:MerR family transcriptional regulator [Deinococcus misasensis]